MSGKQFRKLIASTCSSIAQTTLNTLSITSSTRNTNDDASSTITGAMPQTDERRGEARGPQQGDDEICMECEDQAAEVRCVDCDEVFCMPCRDQQHRRGNRRSHKHVKLLGKLVAEGMGQVIGVEKDVTEAEEVSSQGVGESEGATCHDEKEGSDHDDTVESDSTSAKTNNIRLNRSEMFMENVRYIPLRLTDEERAILKVLEGALRVSEYTDRVDVRSWHKAPIIIEELEEMQELLLGLNGCINFKATCKMVSKDLKENEAFFQKAFEIGRRYKIMNPDKMRTTYGKLLHMLQDAQATAIKNAIEMDLVIPIKTVFSFLQEKEALEILADDDLIVATQDTSLSASPSEAGSLLEEKTAAIAALKSRHASESFTASDIDLVLNSITDSNNYQAACGGIVIKMIKYLEKFFDPSDPTDFTDLSIRYGQRKSKLNHTHSQQFTFVKQTLTLWLEITQHMFHLWYDSDEDMLREGIRYHLLNTGQGLNRMCACPTVSNSMHQILSSVQRRCGRWVGLAVVHLGDRDVPNALFFIDKYTQVPRILGPIVQTLERIEDLAKDPHTRAFVDKYGGPTELQRSLLRDFFRFAFNGDGSDGGSCIDGRLTSAWNWCSRLEKTMLYPVFMLAGFQGFDGSFKN